jgi:glutamate decarboxylase
LQAENGVVPAYTMPPNREDLVVLRIVVRNGFSRDMADLFLRDLRASVESLNGLPGAVPHVEQPSSFHH